jgi:hypothetical protein
MVRSASPLALLVVCCITAQANDESKPAVVKQKAQEVGQAVIKGDYAKIADLTYPKIVEAMGGRDRMIAETEAAMRRMKERGITFRSHTVGEPSEFRTEDGNTFTVLPTTVEMTVPGGRAIGKSYLLGISADGGKTWTFADGSGLDTQEKRDKLLPRLPAKLKLPEKQKPEFIRDK